jgi:(E)-4-hydroxy-3-methylbut-2-enyl-diphosphate synthase
MSYCPDLFRFERRLSRVVRIGRVAVGGDNPIRVQSMLTCDTMDTAACIGQTLELVAAGCEIVRITAPTVRDAANLEHIAAGLRARGCDVPLVADIHFKPEAAMEAAKWVEKVRINPGNYADKKKFAVREYTDAEYRTELDRLREKFSPLVKLCRERGIAMRIGTNHGSLSDRIMNRYGDTPLGMVESALEFARIARDLDYHAFVFSMKASNPKVMIEAYRLLAARLDELDAQVGQASSLSVPSNGKLEACATVEQASSLSVPADRKLEACATRSGWNYPIHLGVTEAGEGEDARLKSAIGIGSLLSDGIGDTIRVSLTEDSVHEIPVARALIECVRRNRDGFEGVRSRGGQQALAPAWDPFSYERRKSQRIHVDGAAVGGEELIKVGIPRAKFEALAHKLDRLGDYRPDFVCEDAGIIEIDPRDDSVVASLNANPHPHFVTVADVTGLPTITAFRLLASKLDSRHPILLKDVLAPAADGEADSGGAFLDRLLAAATNLGSLLCDGIGDAILVQGEPAPGLSMRLAFNLLQAAGARIFKTDYVACPSCGRTLFNLQDTTARIKAATAHLKGVKIAIMGCIVNGPGEMADADFGYVGGAPGKINLYVGRQAVRFNIPESEAVERLVDLIREHGKWMDAPPVAAAVPA